MEVQVASDLHLAYNTNYYVLSEILDAPADVLVLAGDIASGGRICERLTKLQKDSGKIIIYVCGNHEYYNFWRADLDRQIRDYFEDNDKIFFLNESKVELDGVMFLGSTGWFDGSGGDNGNCIPAHIKRGFNDFNYISDFLFDPSVKDGIVWGDKARNFFIEELEALKDTDSKVVCVSHHLPHIGSVATKFANDERNVIFLNRWEHIIEKYQPDLYIHGHTHVSFDYMVDNTRIVCNPYGIDRVDHEATMGGLQVVETVERENGYFNPNKIVTI